MWALFVCFFTSSTYSTHFVANFNIQKIHNEVNKNNLWNAKFNEKLRSCYCNCCCFCCNSMRLLSVANENCQTLWTDGQTDSKLTLVIHLKRLLRQTERRTYVFPITFTDAYGFLFTFCWCLQHCLNFQQIFISFFISSVRFMRNIRPMIPLVNIVLGMPKGCLLLND